MEPLAMRSSNHQGVVQAGISTTSTTPTSAAVNTLVVSKTTTTNQLDFILEDCEDNEGEVPNNMVPILEMVTLVLSTISHQMEIGP